MLPPTGKATGNTEAKAKSAKSALYASGAPKTGDVLHLAGLSGTSRGHPCFILKHDML